MNDIFFDKNFNRKILKKWVSSQTSMLTENNGVTYIEKIENQVNDSGQSSIVPYGSDELEISSGFVFGIPASPFRTTDKFINSYTHFLSYLLQ